MNKTTRPHEEKTLSQASFGACATLKNLKGSVQKVLPVLKQIQGRSFLDAVLWLRGVERPFLRDSIEKLLKSAAANVKNLAKARYDREIPWGSIFVTKFDLGKSMRLKRLDIRGRSRSGRIHKEWSQVSIFVEADLAALEKKEA